MIISHFYFCTFALSCENFYRQTSIVSVSVDGCRFARGSRFSEQLRAELGQRDVNWIGLGCGEVKGTEYRKGDAGGVGGYTVPMMATAVCVLEALQRQINIDGTL